MHSYGSFICLDTLNVWTWFYFKLVGVYLFKDEHLMKLFRNTGFPAIFHLF